MANNYYPKIFTVFRPNTFRPDYIELISLIKDSRDNDVLVKNPDGTFQSQTPSPTFQVVQHDTLSFLFHLLNRKAKHSYGRY